MFNKITITTKPYLDKEAEHKIYCDTAGGFYERKLIDECPENIEYLCQKYQIFKGVLDPETNKPRVQYEMNCLMYAFTMSGVIPIEILTSMKIRCYTRIVSKKRIN